MFGKRRKYDIPVFRNDGSFLRNNKEEFTVTWIGHSTLLIQMNGVNILTDPVWSKRVSPVPFIGPKRHTEPGIKFEDIPDINFVLISHDHYDHFDIKTIKKLGNRPFYLVPRGVGRLLSRLKIDRFREFEWNNTTDIDGITFISAPSKHFSGRGLINHKKTLWCGWIIISDAGNFFYAGDTAYFDGFKQIGEKYGPFDVAALPVGAYSPEWFMRPVHLNPMKALQAFIDLKAENFIPVHWGAFRLSFEPLDEPPKILKEEIIRKSLPEEKFWILKPGETRVVNTIE